MSLLRLSSSLQQDARPLSEAVWHTVQKLRAEGKTCRHDVQQCAPAMFQSSVTFAGRRPLVFASTEREAEAFVRHIGCARRFRKSHPKHCKGCDLCRNFNKSLVPISLKSDAGLIRFDSFFVNCSPGLLSQAHRV